MQDLDAIMDSRPGEGGEIEQQQTTRDDGRDEMGRFASRQAEQQQTPPDQQQADPHQDQQQQDKPPPGFIPQQAFDARLAKAEEKWSDEVNNLRSQLDNAMQRLAQYQPQQQQPSVPKKPFAEALFEDPERTFDDRLHEGIRGAISPIQQQLMFNARLIANSIHSEEKVNEAATAFDRARQSGQIDPRDAARIMESPNPFHEAIGWHKRQSALQTYGDDPEAWKNSEREKIKAELLAEMQGGQQQAQPQQHQQQPERLPSSFAGARSNGPRGVPAFAGPLPLSEIMGGR